MRRPCPELGVRSETTVSSTGFRIVAYCMYVLNILYGAIEIIFISQAAISIYLVLFGSLRFLNVVSDLA